MNVRQAIVAAPPTPACFPDRLQWAAYLAACQETSKPYSRPFDAAGIYRPVFNFCVECTAQHAKVMAHARRCKPSQFRGVAIVKVAA